MSYSNSYFSLNLLQKILNKDPKKRPTLQQLKSMEFFAEVDWALLDRKQLKPPQILNKEFVIQEEKRRKDSLQPDKEMEELESLFEMDTTGKVPKFTFSDEDYTEQNRTVNRVRNYSFSRSDSKQKISVSLN